MTETTQEDAVRITDASVEAIASAFLERTRQMYCGGAAVLELAPDVLLPAEQWKSALRKVPVKFRHAVDERLIRRLWNKETSAPLALGDVQPVELTEDIFAWLGADEAMKTQCVRRLLETELGVGIISLEGLRFSMDHLTFTHSDGLELRNAVMISGKQAGRGMFRMYPETLRCTSAYIIRPTPFCRRLVSHAAERAWRLRLLGGILEGALSLREENPHAQLTLVLYLLYAAAEFASELLRMETGVFYLGQDIREIRETAFSVRGDNLRFLLDASGIRYEAASARVLRVHPDVHQLDIGFSDDRVIAFSETIPPDVFRDCKRRANACVLHSLTAEINYEGQNRLFRWLDPGYAAAEESGLAGRSVPEPGALEVMENKIRLLEFELQDRLLRLKQIQLNTDR